MQYLDDESEDSAEELLAQTIEDSVREDLQREDMPQGIPRDVFIIPLTRRPFFPGMAAPLVIEPGAFYEVLKQVAKSSHKSLGLFLTKKEDANIYKVGFDDLYSVGVLARILRIIPIEQGRAQVVLNMEKRISIKKPIKSGKHLKAQIEYHEDHSEKLSKELKAYSISIITTI